MAQYKDIDEILRQLDEYYITAIVQQKHDDVPEDHKKHWKGVQSGINYARNTIIEAPTADVEPKSKWISVNDELPEKFTNVLCLYPSKNYGSNIAVDYMESDRGYFAEQFRYGEPTHWMPLPTPPTEKEN
jgi:hypothetical protein